MPHKNGDTNFKKKSKIGDMIMNNNVAPNNALFVTQINFLNKL